MKINTENTINHQFLNSKFFLPSWKIQTLILGTFNPSCGEATDYFYGRCQNNFWRAIEEMNNLEYHWFQNNLERKLKFMKDNKFGCTDIIKSIIITEGAQRKEFCGSGYSDQVLFTAKKCTITYNFEEITSFIEENNVSKIINTWGKLKGPSAFKKHIEKLKTFCDQHQIRYVEDCPSPSGRLRGEKHKKNLVEFYKSHVQTALPFRPSS
jgi:hypothetical protein